MNRIVFALLTAVGVMLSAQVDASSATKSPADVKYTLVLESPGLAVRTYSLAAVTGRKAIVSDVAHLRAVTGINSDHGALLVETGTVKDGFEASVSRALSSEDGSVDTVVEYTLWEAGVIASKGRHVVTLRKNRAAQLEGLNGHKLSVTEL
jgi:hypothetical protein